jgi:acyl-CoA dehydrogenase
MPVDRAVRSPCPPPPAAAPRWARSRCSYARIRKQFGLSVGRFEGVEEALARIGGNAYTTSACPRPPPPRWRAATCPAVPSAIAKYHCTEMGRKAAMDSMDILGGKGIILGPRNFAGRSWQAAPIAITVEGANIMTRSLMIFGQGAILCHPWVMKEMKAAQDWPTRRASTSSTLPCSATSASPSPTRCAVLVRLDRFARSAVRRATTTPVATSASSTAIPPTLALMADTSMLLLGGKLKFKESLSGRLGDVLSQLYIASAMLKRHQDDRRAGRRPAAAGVGHPRRVNKIETALSGALRNFPIRPVGWLLWLVIFPWGRRAQAPAIAWATRSPRLLMTPCDARERLAEGVFTTPPRTTRAAASSATCRRW